VVKVGASFFHKPTSRTGASAWRTIESENILWSLTGWPTVRLTNTKKDIACFFYRTDQMN
jgi:hypothetical protein